MDKRDVQILEILAQNCRVSNTTIGQAINLSKDAVSYRIKKLEQQKHLSQYVMFIDARKLGFTRYHLLIKFDSGIADKEAVYQKVATHPYFMWINSFIGRFDMQVIIDAKDGFHLNTIKKELFELCEHKIKEYNILTHISDLEFTQLNPVLNSEVKFQKKADSSFSQLLTTKNFPVGEAFVKYEITSQEATILKSLSNNPKASLVDISKELKIDRATVKKKIESLIKKEIIINFGGIPNLSQQGFVTYYFLVRLEQNTPLTVMKKPFETLQNIFYAGRMIGDYDMILYLNARNPQELHDSIELFKKDIEEHIIHYELLVQEKVHHWKQFTEGIYQSLTK